MSSEFGRPPEQSLVKTLTENVMQTLGRELQARGHQLAGPLDGSKVRRWVIASSIYRLRCFYRGTRVRHRVRSALRGILRRLKRTGAGSHTSGRSGCGATSRASPITPKRHVFDPLDLNNICLDCRVLLELRYNFNYSREEVARLVVSNAALDDLLVNLDGQSPQEIVLTTSLRQKLASRDRHQPQDLVRFSPDEFTDVCGLVDTLRSGRMGWLDFLWSKAERTKYVAANTKWHSHMPLLKVALTEDFNAVIGTAGMSKEFPRAGAQKETLELERWVETMEEFITGNPDMVSQDAKDVLLAEGMRLNRMRIHDAFLLLIAEDRRKHDHWFTPDLFTQICDRIDSRVEYCLRDAKIRGMAIPLEAI